MISENDKQAILNGAYGITRSGRKCKYVGLSTQPVYPYVFIYFDNLGQITETKYVDETLLYRKNDITVFDVIGLWEDRQEPFDLERALAGEPVLLRNGLKAEILKALDKQDSRGFQYFGLSHQTNGGGIWYHECAWNSEFKSTRESTIKETNYDIVGMWKEPEPELNTVTFTLPSALKEPKDEMWVLTPEGYVRSMYNKNIPLDLFNKRIFFNSEEDAKAWFDAMQNSRK